MIEPVPSLSPDGESGVLAYVSRHAALILAAITVGGAILRVFDLGDKSLWFDEAALYWIADGNLGQILAENVRRNSAPPLFALLLSGVIKLGTSEAALRSIACAAGIATIPAVYALARRYVAAPWALFAASLVALSPQQIAFSQQVREYSLTALLAVLLLLGTQAFLDRPGARQALALGTLTTVALLTQYGLGLLLAALGLVSLVTLARSRPPRQVWIRWAGVQVAGLATVGVDIALGLSRQIAAGKGGVLIKASYLEGGYWDGSLGSLRHLIVTQTGRLSDFAFPGLLFVFFCVAGMALAIRDGRGRMALSLFLVPILVTCAAALAHLHPYNGYRQVIFLTPMFYVMAAFGGSALGGIKLLPWQPAAIGGLLLAGQALVSIRTYYWWEGQEALRPIVAELLERREPADQIFVSSRSRNAFSYYVRGTSLQWESGVRPGRDTSQAVAQFDSLLGNPARMWLVFSDPNYDGRSLLLSRVPPARRVRPVRELGRAALYLVE